MDRVAIIVCLTLLIVVLLTVGYTRLQYSNGPYEPGKHRCRFRKEGNTRFQNTYALSDIFYNLATNHPHLQDL